MRERALSRAGNDDIRYQKDFTFSVTIFFRIHFFNDILARSTEKHFISLIPGVVLHREAKMQVHCCRILSTVAVD